MRKSKITRNTNETRIKLELSLDGSGKAEIDTGCGFLDHMLTLFASHGRFDLKVKCNGDTHVDYHHTTEDIGIALGEAFKEALADKKGINRYGYMMLPMDEALLAAAVDFSGRCHLSYDLELVAQKVGDFDTELVSEFWLGFVRSAAATLHIRMLSGSNTHHIIEGAFKACGRAMKMAVAMDPALGDEIPSTKGLL